MKKIFLSSLAAAALAVGSNAYAQIIASDDASGYTTSTWITGSDLGTGFEGWGLATNAATGYAGTLVQSAAPLGSNGSGLNTSGLSFSIYGGGGGTLDAYRPFTAALNAGETFSTSVGFTFDDGNRGLALRDGSGSELFYFNIAAGGYGWSGGGSAPMTTWIGARDNGVIINFAFTGTATGFNYSISSAQDANLTQSGSVAAATAIKEVKYYISGSTGGEQGNFYFNNLSVVPEPSTYALLGLSAMGMAGYMIRRRRR